VCKLANIRGWRLERRAGKKTVKHDLGWRLRYPTGLELNTAPLAEPGAGLDRVIT